MEFIPFYLACLAHASYLVGDRRTGDAAVIDPQRDIDQYLAAAAERRLTIRHVLLTHFHADFIAGHLALAKRLGATIHLAAGAQAEFPFHPLADGEALVLGDVALRALHTPGHTPESMTLLLEEGGRPVRALTGDTLFVGDVGRPDLLASLGASAEDLATSLHASIQRLLALPDEVEVWPAHGAGSLCGRALGPGRNSTIGTERRANWALQPMPTAEFVQRVTTDLPVAPAYFAHDAVMNRTSFIAEPPVTAALTTVDFLATRSAGAVVLDVRDGTAFAGAHLDGALNVPLDGPFATHVGQIVDPDRDLLLIADPGREAEAATRLGRIGFDHLRGHLAGGMAALADSAALLRTHRRWDAAALKTAMAAANPPLIVDVRNAAERAKGAIPDSVHLPLADLRAQWNKLPHDRELVVHCAGGYRSAVATAWLTAQGLVAGDLLGGYGAWNGIGTTCSSKG